VATPCRCFQFIEFPSEWGATQTLLQELEGFDYQHVSNLLSSPASGELEPFPASLPKSMPNVSNLLSSPASGERLPAR